MSAIEQAAVVPSLRDQLEAVLPSWTHWGGGAPFFPGFTATWTTTAGTWSIGTSGISPWLALEGPGGKWAFGSKDADHIIGVLRALDAIPETPGTGSADPDGGPIMSDVCGNCGDEADHFGPCEWICSGCGGTGWCPACRGTGGPDDVVTCNYCDGSGQCQRGCSGGWVSGS